MKKLFVVLFVSGVLFTMSCSKKSSCGSDYLTKAAKELSDAATKYAKTPTDKGACKEYKKALNKYLDDVKDCPGVSAAQIKSARDRAAKLKCD